jgi:NADPH:quinone reductase-like Zn-dependent oxidoreductase
MARFPSGDRHLITMSVIEISAFGPPEVLRPGERATSVAGAGEALTITGMTLRARSIALKSAIARELRATAWSWIQSQLVKPAVVEVFPAAQAHALIESNQQVEKPVLSW